MAGRILVLDDEENYAEMLQDLLVQHNYRVDMVTRPEQAIDCLEEIPYDLVVSDYKMPVMDGADFLKKAREIYPGLPFILVSGLMNTPELVKVANMSVTLVLEKPLDTELFLENVRRFSEPMTDEEARALREGESEEVPAEAAAPFPEEPRFYSAHCGPSRDFLGLLWRAARRHPLVVILESQGGDAGLAVKDLSRYKGQGERAVEEMDSARLLGGDAVALLEGILADREKSDVVCLRGDGFHPARDMEKLRRLEEESLLQVRAAEKLLLVFLVQQPDGEEGVADPLFQHYGERVISNPALRFRLPDVARYISRCLARSGGEGGGAGPALSPGAVFALLGHHWPGNHSELLRVLEKALKACPEGSLSFEAVAEAVGSDFVVPASTAPEDRLAWILRQRQAERIQRFLERGESAPAELATAFGLSDAQLSDPGGLRDLPLLAPALAKF
jgi:CheY-like chemotaxis protein